MTSQRFPSTVVLHLGAHKTASTHLQQSIAAAGPMDGVQFYGPPALREPGKSLPERFGFPLDPAVAGAKPVDTSAMLAEMSQGAARLVISEENFAGKLQTGWGRIPMPLYQTASHRIASLAGVIAGAGGSELDLCLAIRDPATYLTSCYSQILHGQRIVMPDNFLTKNPVSGVNWVDYVTRLRAIPGVGRITVWRFEDYTSLFSQICAAMLGTPAIAPLSDRMQTRLSARAIDAILLAKSLDVGNVVPQAAETYPVTDQNPAFTLFDATALAASQKNYAGQWDRIAALEDVTTLHASNA